MLATDANRRPLLRVMQTDPQSDPRWQAYVSAHPQGLIYHHPRWLEVLEKAHSHRVVALACIDNGDRFCGVLPLCETRGMLTGRRLLSLPHTPVAGPLTDNDCVTALLLRAAVERAKKVPGTRLQVKFPTAVTPAVIDAGVSLPWEQTYVLALPRDPGELRFGESRNDRRIKWAVSKAQRLGVSIRVADADKDLRAWYRLYLETMRWHAVPPRPFHFFATMWSVLRPHGMLRLLLAEQGAPGRTILLAGAIVLMSGGTVFYAFNARRKENLPLRPNDLIQWQAIQDACREGYRHYDFGEVADSNPGLAQFKTKWGAESRRYHRYYYPAPRRIEAQVLREHSLVHRIGKNLWRRLPLGVTARCGKWVYQHA